MRITNQFLFDNFKNDHSRVLKELNTLTSQVSSGQKIQNSYEDSAVYSDILRLESQENDLDDIKKRAIIARSHADASDSVLNDFTQTLRDFKTKLISAANAPLNADNRLAIATELKEQKKHMISLANSQLNGQYLFSGSSVNIKPIDNEGNYHGNSDALMTIVGDGVEIQKNIDGTSLFLGDDLNIHKTIETNVRLKNQINEDEQLTSESSIKDMIGDEFDSSVHFFLSGTKRDGEAFKDIVEIDSSAKIENLLEKIKDDFGDVKVELNDNGNISITDLKDGYSQLEFKMVGVQGLTPSNETNLNNAVGDKIISFSKSNYITAGGGNESLYMDQQYFEKNGGVLKGNIALICNGSFAKDSTKLSSIADGSFLPSKTFNMKVTDINGIAKNISLKLDADSTFSVEAKEYNIFDANGGQNSADDFTLGQLQNVISMVLSDKLPANNPGSVAEFETAVKSTKDLINVSINSKGNLEIVDRSDNLSNIQFSLYDTDANDFSNLNTPSLSFMSNNAVTTQKSDINFFDEIDHIIDSVENGVISLDENSTDPRNIGIQNTLNLLDQMNNHFNTQQAKIGIRSKSLEISEQKADALKVNVLQLKSQTTQVDIAETILRLNQVTLSYEAMLQTIAKVNSLSLLNYL